MAAKNRLFSRGGFNLRMVVEFLRALLDQDVKIIGKYKE